MLTALELTNLINKINTLINGKEYYVSKIYPILDDTYLFKLHHAFEDDILLIISSIGVWRTRYMLKSNKPSYFLTSLNRLVRCKLLSIKQFNNDRIIRIKFLDKMGDEDIIFYLMIELFNSNMILCDSNMRILSMLRHKKRGLKIGEKYSVKIDDRIDPMEVEKEDLYPLLDADDIEGWFAANIALPKSIVRLVIEEAGIRRCKGEEDITKLYNSLVNIRDDIREGRRSLITDDPNYLEAIDRKFSSMILERIESVGEEDRREELMRKINAKEEKKLELIREAKEVRELADRFASNNIDEEDLKKVITLKIKHKGSVYSIASRLYDRAKGLERGVEKIEESIKRSKEELRKIKITKKIEEKRSREWFERYRWFVTSDNIFVVGGRDASSNDILLKRYAKSNDLVFHADIHGSPFFILKDAKENSIKEVSIATASFSRAWREGFNTIDVYYVKREQLKKSNKKGAYTISGKRSYIKNVELKLGVGVIEYNKKRYLVAAPTNIFDKCVIIKPGYDDIKELKYRLMDIDREFMESVSIDDIIRILPSKNIRII